MSKVELNGLQVASSNWFNRIVKFLRFPSDRLFSVEIRNEKGREPNTQTIWIEGKFAASIKEKGFVRVLVYITLRREPSGEWLLVEDKDCNIIFVRIESRNYIMKVSDFNLHRPKKRGLRIQYCSVEKRWDINEHRSLLT